MRVGIVPDDVPDKTMRIQTVIALFERYRLIACGRSWRRTVINLPWPPLVWVVSAGPNIGRDLFGHASGDVISVGNVFGIIVGVMFGREVARNVVE